MFWAAIREWLGSNLRTVEYIFLAIVITMATYAGWHVRGVFDEVSTTAQLAAQAKEITAQCKAAQKITKEANDDLQNEKTRIADELANLKRVRPATCVPIARPSDHCSSGTGRAGGNGLSSEWLLDYAARCETYRSEVIILDKFLDDERK